MATRRCLGCKRRFVPRAQVPNQRYCAEPSCQQVRRRQWRKQKRQTDADYRANQAQAQRRWRERHPEYWRGYRQDHPEYVERNRRQQRQRDHHRRMLSPTSSSGDLAKSTAWIPKTDVPSGRYKLIAVNADDLAKRHAWTVEIEVLSAP